MWDGFSEEENGLDELCTLLGEEEKESNQREVSSSCARKRVKQHPQEKDTFFKEKQESTVANETATMKGVLVLGKQITFVSISIATLEKPERMLAMERELAELKKCLAEKEESGAVSEREGSGLKKKRRAHSIPEEAFGETS